jgi:hypothetical protein
VDLHEVHDHRGFVHTTPVIMDVVQAFPAPVDDYAVIMHFV